MTKPNINAFPLKIGQPRQLMVRDGQLLTLDGKELKLVGFPDGMPVNVVCHERLEQLLVTEALMEGWCA